MRQMPVQGGIRRGRGQTPKIVGGSDQTIISYNAAGTTLGTPAGVDYVRAACEYIPGNSNALASSVGPGLLAQYSSGKFISGTKIRWEPSVSFTTPGRVFVGFSDNPEVLVASALLTNAQFGGFIRSLGNVMSFPVWQETDIPFPTRLRRKRFDTNKTTSADVDVYDRCCQTVMYIWMEGLPASTTVGNFWFHDRVDVEGLHSLVT